MFYKDLYCGKDVQLDSKNCIDFDFNETADLNKRWNDSIQSFMCTWRPGCQGLPGAGVAD